MAMAAAPPARPAPLAPLAPEKLEALAGRYYSEELDATYEIVVADGKLTLLRPHRPAAPLVPQPDGSYRFRSATLDFLAPAADGRTRFTVGGGGAFGIEFVQESGTGANR